MPYASAQHSPKLEFKAPQVEAVCVMFISGFPGPVTTSGMEQVQYKYLSN